MDLFPGGHAMAKPVLAVGGTQIYRTSEADVAQGKAGVRPDRSKGWLRVRETPRRVHYGTEDCLVEVRRASAIESRRIFSGAIRV